MGLTKKQRTRVRRVILNFMQPLNHIKKDGLPKMFGYEIKKIEKLIIDIRVKAIVHGYKPYEELPDVNTESYVRERNK